MGYNPLLRGSQSQLCLAALTYPEAKKKDILSTSSLR
jgi:hypothetical protein